MARGIESALATMQFEGGVSVKLRGPVETMRHGMVVSTVLTLVLVPCVYSLLHQRSARRQPSVAG